ncbi:hypothetical protein [Roseibium album]|uniref:hypothetical protein n=1 Tax=Roseibium album TaxID=311410 RepID=UPI003BAF5C5F
MTKASFYTEHEAGEIRADTARIAAIQHLRAARQCIAEIDETLVPDQTGNFHEATEFIDAAVGRLGDSK